MLIASAVLHVLLFGVARLRLGAAPPPPSIAVELSPLGGGGFEKAPEKPLPALPAAAPKAAAKPAATPAEPDPEPEPEAAEAPPPRPDDAVVPAAKPQPQTKPKPKPKAADKPKTAAKPKETPKATTKAKPDDKPAAAADGKGGSGDSTSALADIRQLLEARKGQGGGQGAGGGDSREFGLPDGVPGRLYFRSVDAAIRAAWVIPPGSAESAVEIEIIIGADGHLISHTLRTPSGDNQLDRSATRAVERATLPPPPAEFRTPLRLILRLIPSEESPR
jgi:TonB family protein